MSLITKEIEAPGLQALSALVDAYFRRWHPAGYGTTLRTIGTKWAGEPGATEQMGRKKLFTATIDRYSSCS